MDNRNATHGHGGPASFVRVIRGFAGAALVALGFAFAILLLGVPVALMVRGLHEVLSRFGGLQGDVSALVQAVLSVTSVAAGVVVAGASVRLVVGFFDWRRRFRARVAGGHTAATRLNRRPIAGAA